MSTDNREEWWLDHSNLTALMRWLIDEQEMTLDQVTYFLEKPWKWSPEWDRMRGVTKRDTERAPAPEHAV